MRKIMLVFLGGFCGTLSRYLLAPPLAFLAHHLVPGPQAFPYDIFVINLSGAYLLGLLYGLAERGAAIPADVRLALGTGFLGAYTTFSTFVTGGGSLLLTGATTVGALYLVGSIILGVGVVRAGHISAAFLTSRQRARYRAHVDAPDVDEPQMPGMVSSGRVDGVE